MSTITFEDGQLRVPDTVTIPVITGDGIGVDITPAMKAVVDAAVGDAKHIDWLDVPAGQAAFDLTGEWMPQATLNACRDYRVSIKGPLATPVGDGHRSLNVALRQDLDLYACVRPVRWFEGVTSPLKRPDRVDMVVFRENTEDVYAGIEWPAGSPEARRLFRFLSDDLGVKQVRFPCSSAFGIKPISRDGSRRLVRAACQYALDHGRRFVTLVHKGNIMKFTEGGFLQWGYELAKEEFPGLVVKDVITDAFLQDTLLHPENYDVIATTNLNGDLASDQLAAMVGGVGIAPGANINYETGHAVFEATHGTAPNLAGTGQANPSSLLLSAVMMLEYLGWQGPADAITAALAACYRQGVATLDIAPADGQPCSTAEFTQAIITKLDNH
ncbi:MAG: isocitrate/isopropylmalate family dehydrogenase [Propionibacteriaceae bacterium]|nr:isocitrate/isopropylmalate family dehydrogenase [Propionibacteriaceae bacterium]